MELQLKSILRICGFVITALILQMPEKLTAQTVDEGVLLFQQGKFVEAKNVFEQILKKDDNNAEAHYRLGLVYLNRSNPQRDVDEAVDQLEEAVDLNPNNADYYFRYGTALGEKTQHAGIIKQAFLAPKVKKAFLRAVELNPKHAQARIGLAQYDLMAPSIMGGDEEEGWKQLDEAIKLDEVQGRSVKASMLERAKKNDEAEREYKALVVSKPGDWRTWKNYGRFCMRATRYDDAIKQFEKYVELRSDTADSFDSLGEGFLKKGDADQAIKMFHKALEFDKNFFSSLQNMGEAYQLKGQKKEAKEMYQVVLANNPPDFYRKAAEKKLKEIE
jgi:tetratricopeptide (TPR) repeat protein